MERPPRKSFRTATRSTSTRPPENGDTSACASRPNASPKSRHYKNGKLLDRDAWRASNLFAHPDALPAVAAWSATVKVDEITPTSYLCVAVDGEHGSEGCYAALRRNGKLVGAPDRAPSYPVNPWENPVRGAPDRIHVFLPAR